MKDYFISDYDSKIAEYTLENVDGINDKDILNNTKKSLEDLLKVVNSEADLVLNEEELKQYEEAINNLISSYDSRVKEIEKIEKAEAEELAAQKKKRRI